MANTSHPQQAARPRHSKVLRWISVVLLSLIILVGLAVLIIWLVVKPKRIIFTVEDASIHNFNLTKDNHLNATFDISLRSYNPNKRVSIYYDLVEVSADYDGQVVAFNPVEPFFQPHRNLTLLGVELKAQNVPIEKSTAKDIRLERSSGRIEINVFVRASIRLKVGMWKSQDRIMRVYCSSVLVHFSRAKSFERKDNECDVEL